MILVTGATGNVGGELVRALAGAGEEVRALIRRDSDRSRLPEGAEAFVGDLNRPETLAGALDGVAGVHLLAGYACLSELLREMRRAGVERIALQSSSAAPDGDLSIAIATIDPYDVAAVSSAALVSGDHEGRSYRLSGPESLLPAERLAILAKILGRN